MPKGGEYRQHAAECVLLAQQLTDPAEKATLLQMAKVWRELADKIDKRACEPDKRDPT
jgi:hypothetical protein